MCRCMTFRVKAMPAVYNPRTGTQACHQGDPKLVNARRILGLNYLRDLTICATRREQERQRRTRLLSLRCSADHETYLH